MKDTILQGNCLDTLKTIPDESVDLIITSPPYWGLRDYGTGKWEGGEEICDHMGIALASAKSGLRNDGRTHRGLYENEKKTVTGMPFKDECGKCGAKRVDSQIGLEPTLKEYLQNLLLVTAECRRILKKSGSMYWNHGDSYGTGSGSGVRDGKQATNRGTQTNKNWQENGKPAMAGYEKSLIMQPYRLAMSMVDEQGWTLRNIINWQKPNAMPSSVEDRYTVDFEPVFFLTKSKKYYFKQQLEPIVSAGDRRVDNGRSEYNGKYDDTVRPAHWGQRAFVTINSEGRNKRTTWSIPTTAFKDAHYAVFPEELVEPMVDASCPPGGGRVGSVHGCGYDRRRC